MTETDEEAVVSKIAGAKEEVVIRKDASERNETVRDTVLRDDFEIAKEPGVERATANTTGITPGTTRDTTTGTTNDPVKPKI